VTTYAYLVVATREWNGVAGVFSSKARATTFAANKNKIALQQIPSGITYKVDTWKMA